MYTAGPAHRDVEISSYTAVRHGSGNRIQMVARYECTGMITVDKKQVYILKLLSALIMEEQIQTIELGMFDAGGSLGTIE
jgi:hypothetical protein